MGILYKYTVIVLLIMLNPKTIALSDSNASANPCLDASYANQVNRLDFSKLNLHGNLPAAKIAAVHATNNAAIQAAMAQATIFKIGESHVPAPAGLPTGFRLLDAQLAGGGWPCGVLTEILCDKQGVGEVSLLLPALLPALLPPLLNEDIATSKIAAKNAKNKLKTTVKTPCLWVSPPYLPYAPGLTQAGLNVQALTIIDAPRTEDALWAGEQALASGAYQRVCIWLRGNVGDTSLRRLHYAAGVGRAHCWLMRPLQAATQPSPAPLRISLQALADGTMRLQLLKLRGMKPGKTIVLSTRYLACLNRDEVDVAGQSATANEQSNTEFNQWLTSTVAAKSDLNPEVNTESSVDLAIRQRSPLPDR